MTPHTAKHKCRNFLETLLKLAREQPAAVATNVRNLIQGLIDGKVEPELFTTKLQGELSSAPQPCLVPFLKKSLPYLQQSLASGELTIEGVRAPPPTMVPSLPPPQPKPTFQVCSSMKFELSEICQIRQILFIHTLASEAIFYPKTWQMLVIGM